jgi:hypothetical protein
MPAIQCPHCGREFQYPESFAGSSVACPQSGCAKAVQLPYLDGTFPVKYEGAPPPPLPTGPRQSAEYYLRKLFDSSVVVGPLSRERVRDLVRGGKVREDDELSPDKKKWWPAARVEPEFFGRAPAQVTCRTCGAVIRTGETTCVGCRERAGEAAAAGGAYGVGAAANSRLRTLVAPEPVADFASARSADAIVAASLDGWLGLFAADADEPRKAWEFPGADRVRVAVADGGGLAAVAAGTERSTRLYLADFGRRRLEDVADLNGPVRALALDPDGEYLAVVDGEECVRLYRVEPWKRLDKFPVRGERFAFCLARDRLAAVEDGRLLLWDLRRGKVVCEMAGGRNDPACPADPVGLGFSEDGDRVFAGTGFLAKAPEGVLFHGPTDAQAFAIGFLNPVVGGYLGGVATMAVVNNAEWIAKDMQRKRWAELSERLQRVTRLRAWDAGSGRMTADLADICPTHPEGIGGAYFSPGREEAVTVGPADARLWGLETGGPRGMLYEVKDPNEVRRAKEEIGDRLRPLVRRVGFTHTGDEALVLVAGAKGIRVAPLARG